MEDLTYIGIEELGSFFSLTEEGVIVASPMLADGSMCDDALVLDSIEEEDSKQMIPLLNKAFGKKFYFTNNTIQEYVMSEDCKKCTLCAAELSKENIHIVYEHPACVLMGLAPSWVLCNDCYDNKKHLTTEKD